jgi:hypothetical protein
VPSALPTSPRSGHKGAVTGKGVNHPPHGAPAHDCFDHPEVVGADDRIGDIWMARLPAAARLVRHGWTRRVVNGRRACDGGDTTTRVESCTLARARD